MQQAITQDIVRAKQAVRRKLRTLQGRKFASELASKELFKPLIHPLKTGVEALSGTKKEIADTLSETKKELQELKREVKYERDTSMEKYESAPGSPKDDMQELFESSLKNLKDDDDDGEIQPGDKSSVVFYDDVFGPKIREENLPLGFQKGTYLGNKSYSYIEGQKFIIGDKEYTYTPGLHSLIYEKYPERNKLYTEDDKKKYEAIILDTNLAYNWGGHKLSSRGEKYNKIIKPVLKVTVPPTGEGLISCRKRSNPIYISWSDPNELCERLRLLVSSRAAGNTGVNREIEAIISELRRAGIVE